MFLLWIYDKILSCFINVFYVEQRNYKNGMNRYIKKRLLTQINKSRVSISTICELDLCYTSHIHHNGYLFGTVLYWWWVCLTKIFNSFIPNGYCDMYKIDTEIIALSIYFPLSNGRLYWYNCFLQPNRKNDIVFAHILDTIYTSSYTKIRLGSTTENSKLNIGATMTDIFW